MPISPPMNKADGFTLIEMLVVLTIVALVGALAATRMRPTTAAYDQRVSRVRARLMEARAAAMTDGRPASVDIGALDGKDMTIQSEGGPPLTFYPDGSASGGAVALAGKPILVVDWLTGLPRDPR